MGELEGSEDPCAAVSKELPMSITSHMVPQMSMLGNLSFPSAVLGIILDGEETTDGVGLSAFIFVGSLVLQLPCLETAAAVCLIEYALELVISSTAALVAALLIGISSTAVLMAALLTGISFTAALMAVLLIGISSNAALMAAPLIGISSATALMAALLIGLGLALNAFSTIA